MPPARRGLAAGAHRSTSVRPAIQQVLDAITDAPAWVRNGRHDILAMNQLARALYLPVLEDPRRPANTTRFVYLHPDAARGAVRRLRPGRPGRRRDAPPRGRPQPARQGPHRAGRRALHPSELFRKRWASQDVRYHRSGRKRLRHPVVGQLDLDFEALELPSEPGLTLNIYTAAAGTPTSDALKLLASWAASQEELATERASAKP